MGDIFGCDLRVGTNVDLRADGWYALCGDQFGHRLFAKGTGRRIALAHAQAGMRQQVLVL